jgi:hypothetical protein
VVELVVWCGLVRSVAAKWQNSLGMGHGGYAALRRQATGSVEFYMCSMRMLVQYSKVHKLS